MIVCAPYCIHILLLLCKVDTYPLKVERIHNITDMSRVSREHLHITTSVVVVVVDCRMSSSRTDMLFTSLADM